MESANMPLPSVPQYNPQQAGYQKTSSRGLIAVLVALIISIGVVSAALVLTGRGPIGLFSVENATVSFAGGENATGKMDSTAVKKGETYNLPVCDYSRSGYEFDCWEDESGNEYAPGSSVIVDEDMRFTAMWIQKATDETSEQAASSTQSEEDSPSSEPDYKQGFIDMVPTTKWEGSYEGRDDYGNVVTRLLLLELESVTPAGELKGTIRVGASAGGADPLYGSYRVEGTVDWGTGDLFLQHVAWINKGSLTKEKKLRGKVNWSDMSMSGEFADLNEGNYKYPWHVSPATNINWDNYG